MKFFHKEITLEVPDDVYYPREDSLLLAEILEETEIKNKKVLDMGCGSGFLGILTAKQNEVTASDINEKSVEITRENAKINAVSLMAVHSDLFENINGKFDIIVFNPPYLPEKEPEINNKISQEWHGGPTGREVIKKFLEKAGNHLNKNGKILILFSSVTGEREVEELFYKYNFLTKIIKRKKIPWEELIVVEAKLLENI